MTEEEENIWDALRLFIVRFRVFLVAQIERENPGNWEPVFRKALYNSKNPQNNKRYENWVQSLEGLEPHDWINKIDYQYIEVFAKNRQDIFQSVFKDNIRHLPIWLHEIANLRHSLAHFSKVDSINTALPYLERIAEIINDTELQHGLKAIKDKSNGKI